MTDRIIFDCPICGRWSGPNDGDASHIVTEVCPDCIEVGDEDNCKDFDENEEGND